MRLTRRAPPGAGTLDPEVLWGLMGAASLVLIHAGLKPSLLGIPCLFKHLTALPCPSCGMTRCWEALGAFDWGHALRLHPPMALGYFSLWAYVPYAAGAVAGLWPRIGLVLPPPAGRWIRAGALLAFAATWGFLVWDGR